MRVQTLLNKNSKLNPSGRTRPPIRFFSFFFFLLQATAQKYLWLQRNMEKNNKSRVDLRFRDLTQKQESRWKRFVQQGAVLYRPFLLGYLLMLLKTFSYPSASLVLSSSTSVTSLRPSNAATYWQHQNTSQLFMNCIRGLFTIFCSY